MDYQKFLEKKETIFKPSGFDIDKANLNPMMFEWQKDIAKWAIKKGKCALFLDCGLGKTLIQLEWMEQILKELGGTGLILAPLAVAHQTKREGLKFGYNVNIARTHDDLKVGINITNYEMMERFDFSEITAIVLDESSIIKDQTSKTKIYLIESTAHVPYKLACTATPAPNDFKELGTHSEFLGVMKQSEMLSTYFINDTKEIQKWRLKGHAERRFWEWIASWAAVMTKPSDLGYPDGGYDLPKLNVIEHVVKTDEFVDGEGQVMLVPKIKMTLNDRRQARRETLEKRVGQAADIANNESDQVLVWCDLNSESEMLHQQIIENLEIKGSDSTDYKTEAMEKFTNEEIKSLVSKPSISGWGMNWQQCHNMIFVGLSDSFEAYYQAVRRCWRFGQTKPVNVHIVISDQEGTVRDNIIRKQQQAERMTAELVKHTKAILKKDIQNSSRNTELYHANDEMIIPSWLRSKWHEC